LPSKIAFGLSPFLEVAAAAWSAEQRVVPQHPDYTFDVSRFELPAGAEIFVAIDNRFLNHKRLELAALLASRGHALATVVARTAVVDGTLGTGVFVGEGAVIGPGAEIGDYACIHARAVIGPGAKLARGTWIDPGAIVGGNTSIGERTSIGSGVVIPIGTEIGESCVLAVPGIVRGPIAARTYLHPLFVEPIRVFVNR
jgi:serine acetyltransferase